MNTELAEAKAALSRIAAGTNHAGDIRAVRVAIERLDALSTPPADDVREAMTGVALIAAERHRQMSEEGYTPEHDQDHAAELTWAARCYAENVAQVLSDGPTFAPGTDWCTDEKPAFQDFPWPWHKDFWKPTGDPVRDLVKAGSLIAAAIDSLTETDVCTCPSGDGSLRWPCPTHPPTEVRSRGTVAAEAREAEMRELHHFEVEQQLAETIAIVKRAQAAALKHEHTPASLHMDAILDEVNTEIPSGAEVRPRGTVTDALYCAHCQNDDHASSACEARGTVTAPGLRCPACGWSTSNREAEQHVCPGPSYATALRAIANGDGPRFVREFARDTLEAEPQVRPRGAVTDAAEEREALAWAEAELYAGGDEYAQEDFVTGWRVADRTRMDDGRGSRS